MNAITTWDISTWNAHQWTCLDALLLAPPGNQPHAGESVLETERFWLPEEREDDALRHTNAVWIQIAGFAATIIAEQPKYIPLFARHVVAHYGPSILPWLQDVRVQDALHELLFQTADHTTGQTPEWNWLHWALDGDMPENDDGLLLESVGNWDL